MNQQRTKGGIGMGWGLLAVVAATLGGITMAALGSVVAEAYPLQAAGFAVAGITLFGAVLLPLGLSSGIARVLRSRGIDVGWGRVAAGTVTGWNLAAVVLVQVLSPVTVKDLWMERGTWVVDAMLDRGPFGPAAIPVVTRRLAEVEAAVRLDVAAPLWCDEGAGAFAVGLAEGLRDGAPVPLADTMTAVLARHGVGPERVPGSVLDGRALLDDVADLAAASGPAVDLPPQAPVDATPTAVARRRIVVTTPGWEARYEDGAWRWCTGTAAEAEARGHAHAIAMRQEAARVPAPTSGGVAGPWDGVVRLALQNAAFGRSAWLAGVSTFDPAWTESLTRAAAAAQGERLRTWCTPAAAGDPSRTDVLTGLAGRWTLPEAGRPLDPSVQSLLDAQGRRYLQDLLAACAPVAVDRQVREAGHGLSISDPQRRRWAELEARSIASAAVLQDDGTGGVKIEVDGRTLRAVQEDGAWRIDWRD